MKIEIKDVHPQEMEQFLRKLSDNVLAAVMRADPDLTLDNLAMALSKAVLDFGVPNKTFFQDGQLYYMPESAR